MSARLFYTKRCDLKQAGEESLSLKTKSSIKCRVVISQFDCKKRKDAHISYVRYYYTTKCHTTHIFPALETLLQLAPYYYYYYY